METNLFCAVLAFGVGLPYASLCRKAGSALAGFPHLLFVGAVIGVLLSSANMLAAYGMVDAAAAKVQFEQSFIRIGLGILGSFVSWAATLAKARLSQSRKEEVP